MSLQTRILSQFMSLLRHVTFELTRRSLLSTSVFIIDLYIFDIDFTFEPEIYYFLIFHESLWISMYIQDQKSCLN